MSNGLFDVSRYKGKLTPGWASKLPHKKRKRDISRWSYYRRLIHYLALNERRGHVSSDTWHKLYNMNRNYLNFKLTGGHLVKSNSWKLENAVESMRQYKELTPEQQKQSSQSIRKIASSWDVTLPTMYRAYYRKYKK